MRIVLVLLLFLAPGCTTLGVDDAAARDAVDYGPPETIRLCILQDDTLGDMETTALITAIRQEMAPFGLIVEIPWVKPWKREGFDYIDILRAVALAHPLTPPCDRIAAFIGRNAADIVWGAMLMPEVLGAVENVTRTRSFMIADFGSVNQLISSPTSVAAHEFYHMLGCDHDLTMDDCYRQIARLKKETRAVRAAGIDMAPGRTANGEFIADRRAIDALLARAALRP